MACRPSLDPSLASPLDSELDSTCDVLLDAACVVAESSSGSSSPEHALASTNPTAEMLPMRARKRRKRAGSGRGTAGTTNASRADMAW
jgi:hypothetical protein